MSWPEVISAKKDNRHEIILSGREISERISKDGLDAEIFGLTNLNYLSINDTSLTVLPEAISNLMNLQTLVLHSNRLDTVTSTIAHLDKLKVLDLSRNKLKVIPAELSTLTQLTTFNVSFNRLEKFPAFRYNAKLCVLDVANNSLSEFPDVCYSTLSSLSELKLSANKIENIPETISDLLALKNMDISSNQIKIIPGELAECSKMKDVNLKDNPITDKRLLKLIEQCRPKQVLDYVRQHCTKSGLQNNSSKAGKRGKKGAQILKEEMIGEQKKYEYRINVRRYSEHTLKIIVDDRTKSVRGYILGCLVYDLDLCEERCKKFIQLQTKLHDNICEKRNAATIATHDLNKINGTEVTYTTLLPDELLIKPLNRSNIMTGAQLFSKLQVEADNLRKEKKRNVYSGIHRFLYLIEGQARYPCLRTISGEIISFPPITNSDVTKVSPETTSLFIEVTSATSQHICKKIMDYLLKEMMVLFGPNLTVQQVKNVDIDGNLRSVYPSRSDLTFEDSDSIEVIRE